MTSTPQKNQASHFDNPYSGSDTPQKQLDAVEQVTSQVLKERNRHSDIFNREGAPEAATDPEPEPVKPIRSNDAENDSAAARFRTRNQASSMIFGSDPGAASATTPSPTATSPTTAQPQHKISNIF